MEKSKLSWNDFLKYFIENEKFRQNPLLKTEEFIKYCAERGIKTNKEQLEFFERESLIYPVARLNVPIVEEKRIKFLKDGKECWRPGSYLQEGETEIEKYIVKLYAPQAFREDYKDNLLELLEQGDLYHPSEKPFIPWVEFKGERLEYSTESVISFYSSFQILSLIAFQSNSTVLLSFSTSHMSGADAGIKETNEGRVLLTNILLEHKIPSKDELSVKSDEEYESYLKSAVKRKKEMIDWVTCKAHMLPLLLDYENMLRFLLTIQNIYIPHMKSGSRRIQLSNMEDAEWQELKKNFNLDAELSFLGLDILAVCQLYIKLSRLAENQLGGFSSDWAHLFKNIGWDKKEKLKGSMRLGIDYLQWAIMLKRILEEHLQRKVFEVDEASNMQAKQIVEIDPSNKDTVKTMTLRHHRLDYYYDEAQNKDYFYDRNKRLYYLVNSFDLDYQPRVMLFVEGETEENVLPMVFEWYFGLSVEDMGIEIINFKGVSQMLSTSENADKLRKVLVELQKEERTVMISPANKTRLNQVIKDLRDVDIVISNWTSFLSYNLEKWQILPFFLSDDEGNIRHFLEAEKPVKFDGDNYDVPKRLRFFWGIDNDNKPFEGKNFEFANFSDEELSSAINKVLGEKVKVEDLRELRSQGHGINKVDGVDRNKVAIGKELVQNLMKAYKDIQDKELFKRPLFGVISKVADLANLNHLPTSRKQEMMNKVVIKKWLSEK